ncbi:MAG: carbohydrate-binding protein, partial [Limisphaerales bacterium]
PQSYTFEAEDYNYTDANGQAGLYMDNPQIDAYAGAFATEGIDDHVTSTGGNNVYGRSSYPGGTGPNCLSIESCGDQMRDAYTAIGAGNYDLGSAVSGNWANYTRNFSTGTFNIYMRAASANASTTDSASLAQVLSDPAQPNQTAASLGTFSVPNTGGWQSYQWVPLMDQFGKLARVTGGLGTLRLITDKGGYNADFLLLVPAQAGLNSPPYANAFTPDGTSALYQYTNKCVFLVHSSVGISTDKISVAMDGVTIAGLTFSGAPSLWNVTAPVSVNGYHTATITMTDSVGTTMNTFQFNTFDPEKSYLFEAEDFNYTDGTGSPGQYFDDPNTVNQYVGLPATQGIDAYSVPGNLGASLGYRGGGSTGTLNNGLNCENASDSLETTAHAGQQNYDLGSTANGNWGNYTRSFPTGTYNIYMRAANGNGGASARGSAALVTAGATSASQTLATIGSFDPVPPTGGWQIYTWVACKDNNGNLGQVTLSGNPSTLRITSGGGYNADYFVLVPVNTTLPSAANLYPNGLFQAQGTNTLSFDAISSAGISTNSIVVILNGVTLTNLAITGSSTNWHVSYSGLQPNTFYTVTITFANVAGAPYTTTFSFDTYSPGNYQWEAEDWDYTSNSAPALFFDNPQVDRYFGAGSTAGIDAGQVTYNTSMPWVYRPYDPANLTPGTDINDDVPRAQFGTNSDYRVNWFGYGSWANYTRDYPKGTYYVI